MRGGRCCEERGRLYLQEPVHDEELHEEMRVCGTLVHIQESSPGCSGLKTHSDAVDGAEFHGSELQIGIPKVLEVAGILENRGKGENLKSA